MGASLELLKWELRQIFFDKGFLGKIALGMIISLLLLPFLLNSLSSFTENVSAPNLPFVYKIVSIGVVGENQLIRQKLDDNTLLNILHLESADATRKLSSGEIVGVLYLTEKSANFVGNNGPLASLAELHIRDAVDDALRPERGESVKAIQKESIEPFVKGIIAPFILFSPLLLWCLPIIQSISYDRENKMLEALFSLPIERKRIFLAKVLANFIFAAIAGFAWLMILAFFGLVVNNLPGVWVVMSLISLLIISLNGLVSTISSNVKNATLAAGITSTIVFSFLFIISLLRINPYLSQFSAISPITYISYQVSAIPAAFPFNTFLVLMVLIATAIVLSIAAFSTEKFAFSLNPGISQLYEGMQELLKRTEYSAIAMGFVAFSLTFPVQVIALGIVLFVSSSAWAVILILAGIEEFLKFIAIKIISPNKLLNGLLYGALIGAAYGLAESLLFAPFLPVLHLRIIPIIAHAIFTALAGAGVALKRPYFGLAAAILAHFIYNFTVLRNIL